MRDSGNSETYRRKDFIFGIHIWAYTETMSDEEKTKLKTLDVRSRNREAIKPAELIQVTGHHELTLNARRSITILWYNAHVQGIEEGRDYSIEIDDLKPDNHKGYEMVEEAIEALMRTILTVKLANGKTRRVQFLGGNDLDDPDRPAGALTYSFDKRLIEILRDSTIWGKIAIPVLMAFTSKYAVSLYEKCRPDGQSLEENLPHLHARRVPRSARRPPRALPDLRRTQQACDQARGGRGQRTGGVRPGHPAGQAGQESDGDPGVLVDQGADRPCARPGRSSSAPSSAAVPGSRALPSWSSPLRRRSAG